MEKETKVYMATVNVYDPVKENNVDMLMCMFTDSFCKVEEAAKIEFGEFFNYAESINMLEDVVPIF